MTTPIVFVGSSKEAIEIAKAVKRALEAQGLAKAKLWNEGAFGLNMSYLESLFAVLDEVDFAVLVASPEGRLVERNQEFLALRDNILFEAGLFMGGLGRRRAHILWPNSSQIKAPTDWDGIERPTYDEDKVLSKDYDAAIQHGIARIRDVILSEGPRERLEKQIESISIEQQDQRRAIEETTLFLLENFLTEFEKVHLRKVGGSEAFRYAPRESFRNELSRLLGLGLVERQPGKSLRDAMKDQRTDNDLREYLRITQKGRDYLARLASDGSTHELGGGFDV